MQNKTISVPHKMWEQMLKDMIYRYHVKTFPAVIKVYMEKARELEKLERQSNAKKN